MSSPDERMEGMIKETLARVASLGKPDSEVERAAEIPQAFLAKSRAGKNRHPSSAGSWAKLQRWLATQPHAGKGMAAPAAAAAETAESARAPDVETGQLSAPGELANRFRKAADADDLLEIDREIAARTVGGMEPKLSEALQGWSRELRQVLELQEKHAAREELVNLVPMTATQAAEFWEAQEDAAARILEPGEAARPPEKSPT